MSRFTQLCVHLAIVVALGITQSNCISAQSQEEQPAVSVETTVESAESDTSKRYLVTVAEYRLKEIGPSQLTTDGITAAIKEQNSSPVEAVMLSATEGNESRVSIGRQVSVITGKTTTRNGNIARSTRIDLGTILSVELMSEGERVKAELSYEASRLSGERTEDSPPEVVSTSVNTSQVFDLGQPTLVAASTGNGSYYVLLTITRR